jgi:hypothetical protein
MKRLVLFLLMLSGALLVGEAFLLATPVRAEDCTVNCADGSSHTCSGYLCVAKGGSCTAWDSRGRRTEQFNCPN